MVLFVEEVGVFWKKC